MTYGFASDVSLGNGIPEMVIIELYRHSFSFAVFYSVPFDEPIGANCSRTKADRVFHTS